MKKIACLLLFLSALLGAAENHPVLVSAVNGRVFVSQALLESPVNSLSSLPAGTRLRLMAGSRVSLLYPSSGRLESWEGAGELELAAESARRVNGDLAFKEALLPASVARQLARIPATAEADVKPQRTRAFGTEDHLAKLDQQYRQLRASLPESDVEPELFLLSGLFELREFDRLESTLASLATRYPDDGSIKMVARLYQRSINNARQARR